MDSVFFLLQWQPCSSIPLQQPKYVRAKSLQLCLTLLTPWTAAHQAPLSTGFSRQEYWNGLPFPSPGDPFHPGIELESSALKADLDSLSLSQKESPVNLLTRDISYKPDDAIFGVSLFAALDLCAGHELFLVVVHGGISLVGASL